MRSKSKSKHELVSFIWAILVNVSLGVIVLVMGKFSNAISEEIEFLTVALISSITVLLYIYKNEIVNSIIEQSVYQLVEKIEDHEMRNIGIEQLRLCKQRLLELTHGTINSSNIDLFDIFTQKLKKASTIIKATHVAMSKDELYTWLDQGSTINNYYQLNLDIVKKGIVLERTFILRKEAFIDTKTGKLDERTKKVINKQVEDGIKVYLVWEETARIKGLWEDFVIIDSECVYVKEPTGSVLSGGWKVQIKKRKDEIDTYIKKYNALTRTYSISLDSI